MNVRSAARRLANYSVQLDIFEVHKYALEPSEFDPIQKKDGERKNQKSL